MLRLYFFSIGRYTLVPQQAQHTQLLQLAEPPQPLQQQITQCEADSTKAHM
jgi:hypothetical protein